MGMLVMRSYGLGMFALLASVTWPLAAQHTAPVFEQLAGEWRGEGTLMGRQAQFTMSWQTQDGFAVLTFSNSFVAEDGQVTSVLNSAAIYRTSPDNPEAVWLDSRGVRVQIRWETSDSALLSNWTAPTESGRTTYHVRSQNEIEVVDEVMSGDAWRTFATARYTRDGARIDR
jgi:hypothetical protein